MNTIDQKIQLGGSCRRFFDLRQSVIKHPQNEEIVMDFFNSAIESGEITSARSVFDHIQRLHPGNHQIRKLNIALSLHAKDDAAAMDAIETLLAFSRPEAELIASALTVRNRLGPLTLDGVSPNRASISLCMIVKNEQSFLGPCLNAIKHLVDEIILVDTGSTDRTADIGRIYGARVFDFQWCDDFSAARNLSLDRAQGDWILILDADEIIAPKDQPALRKLVERGADKNRAYAIQTRNYTNLANAMDWQGNAREYPDQEAGLGWFPTTKVRLFPRSDRIRFVYPVHELVDPSIRAAGMTIADCPVPIHHYGNINEAKNAQKARSYFDLGYAKLEQLGNDRGALRELAVQAGQLKLWRQAIDLWKRLLTLSTHYGEAHVNIAGAYWQLGAYAQGAAFSQKAIEIDPETKEGHYNLAANLMMDGQAGEAVQILKGLISRHPDYLAAEFMLGTALSLKGDLKKSRLIFKSVEEKITSQALAIAIGDMIKKLSGQGWTDQIAQLTQAAGMDTAPHSDSSKPC